MGGSEAASDRGRGPRYHRSGAGNYAVMLQQKASRAAPRGGGGRVPFCQLATTAASTRPPTAPRGTVIVYILDQHVTASLLTTLQATNLHSVLPLSPVNEPP